MVYVGGIFMQYTHYVKLINFQLLVPYLYIFIKPVKGLGRFVTATLFGPNILQVTDEIKACIVICI